MSYEELAGVEGELRRLANDPEAKREYLMGLIQGAQEELESDEELEEGPNDELAAEEGTDEEQDEGETVDDVLAALEGSSDDEVRCRDPGSERWDAARAVAGSCMRGRPHGSIGRIEIT